MKNKPIFKILAVLLSALLLTGCGSDKEPAPVQTRPQATETEGPTLPPLEPNPYNPLDFYYENDYLTCGAGESALGIDVSYWQENIDWQQVKDAGVEFVIIRVAHRGTHEGKLEADTRAQGHYEGAIAAGLRVGAYVFSQAITPEEAVEEAELALELTKDWTLEMPIVYDWEYVEADARTGKMDPRTLTDCTKAFCRTIEDAGFDAMIYFNADQSHKRMYLEELQDYGFWLALYKPTMDYPYRIDMWQYTDEGSVPGISGNVDLNLQLIYD